jgi:hypothetical protein
MLLYPVTDVLGVRFCAGGHTIESGGIEIPTLWYSVTYYSHSPPDFSLTKILEHTH